MPRDEPVPTARAVPMAEQPDTPEAAAVVHHVTDEQMHRAGLGHLPRALCGRSFQPACLLTPLGRTCPACATATTRAAVHTRRPTRRGLRRMLALRTRKNP